ncbi:MAG: ATP-binding protein [Clostridiales bacterium]|nr:ATP-binding protein [Clostridiales bacterium]MBE5754756.1 ATP-binding protein [Clostridiales bacterium]
MGEFVIKRDLYLNKLIRKKNNGSIKIITGLRRSGKSYLLNNLYYEYLLSEGVKKEQIIKLALDDDRNREYRNPDNLSKFLYSKITNETDKFYFLLDEVQFAISDEEIKSKEPIRLYGILNGLLRLKNVDVYVTGSNSKFLSSDIATEFRGRGDLIHVNPLSFAEFYSVYKNGDKYDAWDEYSAYGGMPMLLGLETDEEKAEYLNNLFKNTYIKDIIERNNLRGDVAIDTLVDVLASSIGSLNNPTKIAKTFASNGIKTADKTISTYVDYLLDAFLIRKATRYDIKGRKYINSPFKYYFSDVGLRNARLNFRQQEQTHIMENIIYNELVMRGFNVDVGIIEHVVRDENGKRTTKHLEIDFVCNKGNQRYYIQSAFSIPNIEKMAQEQASLDRIDDSFKKIIITQDRTKLWRNEKGYVIMNVLDFLLKENSLEL